MKKTKKLKNFYVFDEHQYWTKDCAKMKMFPFKYEGNDEEFFKCNDTVYKVLYCNECYSGFTVTLMKLPERSADEFLALLSGTKDFEEFVGSIGMLKAKYPAIFERALYEDNYFDEKRKRKILKELKRISEIVY